MKSNLSTDFGWKPVVRLPENIPSATFIQGNDAKEFLAEYEGRVKADYGNSRVLRVFSYDKYSQLVRGSNTFAVVLVNQMIRNQGMRTATPADLENVLATEALPLRGQYEDTGIVVRSEDGANDYLAGQVVAQVRERMPKSKFPIMIPLAGLDITTDGSSPHGLGFKLRDDAQVIYAPILNKEGNFSETDSNGLPKEIGSGNRYNYTRSNGLSRLYLDGSLVLGSSNDDLVYSSEGGRVVLISGEATGEKILEGYCSQQNANFAELEASAKASYHANMKRIAQLKSELKLG